MVGIKVLDNECAIQALAGITLRLCEMSSKEESLVLQDLVYDKEMTGLHSAVKSMLENCGGRWDLPSFRS